MRMWLLVVALVGCGEIKDEPIDAPKPIDSPVAACTDMTSLTSCGPACSICTSTGDREMATCDGTACGILCRGGAPRCSDNSCSRTLFDFNTMTAEGATPRSPNGLVLAVRTFMGSPALAIDVTNLSDVSFRVPVCLSGTGPFANRTVSAKVFFDGTPTTGGQYYVQTSVPAPQTGAYLGTHVLDAGTFSVLTAPMSMSNQSATTTDITFQAGTLGAAFSGTIYFDDIKLE